MIPTHYTLRDGGPAADGASADGSGLPLRNWVLEVLHPLSLSLSLSSSLSRSLAHTHTLTLSHLSFLFLPLSLALGSTREAPANLGAFSPLNSLSFLCLSVCPPVYIVPRGPISQVNARAFSLSRAHTHTDGRKRLLHKSKSAPTFPHSPPAPLSVYFSRRTERAWEGKRPAPQPSLPAGLGGGREGGGA